MLTNQNNNKPQMKLYLHLYQDKAALADHLIGVGVKLKTTNNINITGFRVDKAERRITIEYERG